MWACKCDCGNTKTLKSIVLRRGLSQSCGCLKLEVLVERSTKHGHSPAKGGFSPTYHSWTAMMQRCTNQNSERYKDYGGRGIAVCERWHEFANFLADMGEKPFRKSLDRIDNSGNYEPANCRWATFKAQGRNKRNNRALTVNGETRLLVEWAELRGMKPQMIRDRLADGWTEHDAVMIDPLR